MSLFDKVEKAIDDSIQKGKTITLKKVNIKEVQNALLSSVDDFDTVEDKNAKGDTVYLITGTFDGESFTIKVA